jgi:hypothetical protein
MSIEMTDIPLSIYNKEENLLYEKSQKKQKRKNNRDNKYRIEEIDELPLPKKNKKILRMAS